MVRKEGSGFDVLRTHSGKTKIPSERRAANKIWRPIGNLQEADELT